MPSEARLVKPDAHGISTEASLARRAITVTQCTFGRFSRYLSLICTVALGRLRFRALVSYKYRSAIRPLHHVHART